MSGGVLEAQNLAPPVGVRPDGDDDGDQDDAAAKPRLERRRVDPEVGRVPSDRALEKALTLSCASNSQPLRFERMPIRLRSRAPAPSSPLLSPSRLGAARFSPRRTGPRRGALRVSRASKRTGEWRGDTPLLGQDRRSRTSRARADLHRARPAGGADGRRGRASACRHRQWPSAAERQTGRDT